jgi:hypothetical protein
MRRDKLGGLDAQENSALKDSLYRDIDRQRAGAMRDVARTPGLGAGASFAQQRALQRDYGDQANAASRQLLLDNIALKRQALGDFEGTTAARQSGLAGMEDRMAGFRDAQAATRMGVDQFNAGQQGLELAARTGAFSTGAGLVKDEQDRIDAKRKQKKLLKFLKNIWIMDTGFDRDKKRRLIELITADGADEDKAARVARLLEEKAERRRMEADRLEAEADIAAMEGEEELQAERMAADKADADRDLKGSLSRDIAPDDSESRMRRHKRQRERRQGLIDKKATGEAKLDEEHALVVSLNAMHESG